MGTFDARHLPAGAQQGLRPNVFTTDRSIPEAAVEFALSGVAHATIWRDDGTGAPPGPLSHVAVFDQSAATAYVTEKQDASIRPAGLDLLTGLASRSVTAPTSSTAVTVKITMEESTTSTTAIAGLHMLPNIAFGIGSTTNMWSAQVDFPYAWAQL